MRVIPHADGAFRRTVRPHVGSHGRGEAEVGRLNHRPHVRSEHRPSTPRVCERSVDSEISHSNDADPFVRPEISNSSDADPLDAMNGASNMTPRFFPGPAGASVPLHA